MGNKSSVLCVLLATALSLPMLASPIDYTITFTTTSGSPPPMSGSFTYDPVTGFSNFVVMWDGLTFDETVAANAPLVMDACNAQSSSPAYGFEIMSETVPGCPSSTMYTWEGQFNPGQSFATEFLFLVMPPSVVGDEIGIAFTAGTPGTPSMDAAGTWSLTAVPEPPTIGFLLTGMGVGLLVRKIHLNRR